MANAASNLKMKARMKERIRVLSDEMYTDEEYNRAMQPEIDALWRRSTR